MNKISIFCMSIIISILSPSECFTMWWNETVEWNRMKFDRQLENQDYSWLMKRLYSLLADTNDNREIFQWIEDGAEAGHVPMMYMFLRDYAKALEAGVVIRYDHEWAKIGKYLLLSFVRLYQDEIYCMASGNTRGADWNPLSWVGVMASKSERDIFSTFRKKYHYWFGLHNLAKHIPFADALASVIEWFNQHDDGANSVYSLDPGWAKYAYPCSASQSQRIVFETAEQPMLKVVLVQSNQARKSLGLAALKGLQQLNNWIAFFAEQEAFSYNQSEIYNVALAGSPLGTYGIQPQVPQGPPQTIPGSNGQITPGYAPGLQAGGNVSAPPPGQPMNVEPPQPPENIPGTTQQDAQRQGSPDCSTDQKKLGE